MKPIQVWLEGYKARGEACKQGGIVSAVLLAVVAASIKSKPATLWAVSAAITLAFAVAFSALAYLFIGNAVTAAAESQSKAEEMPVSEITSYKKLMFLGNASGFLEVAALGVGLGLAVTALLLVPTPPPGQSAQPPGLTSQQWLAVWGAGVAALGSLVVALSLHNAIRELNIARATFEAMVAKVGQPDSPEGKAFDQRSRRAKLWGNRVVWAGVLLLVAGIVLAACGIAT